MGILTFRHIFRISDGLLIKDNKFTLKEYSNIGIIIQNKKKRPFRR
jgi:hypothetical protein